LLVPATGTTEPSQESAVSQIPPDAPRSEDGQWWWDGATWQPVDAPAAGAAAAPPRAGSAPTGATYSGSAAVAGAGISIPDIDLSVSDVAAVLIAANIDIGSGGNDPSAPNSREEYA
jgi:hypothetical protein